MWSYAEMSKAAGAAGGPEKWLKTVKEASHAGGVVEGSARGLAEGLAKGRLQGAGVGAAAGAAGALVVIGGVRFVQKRLRRRAAAHEQEAARLAALQAEGDAAETQLIEALTPEAAGEKDDEVSKH